MAEKYSYFDDFTEVERKMVFARMQKHGQTWKEIIQRFGHPSKWVNEQIRMF